MRLLLIINPIAGRDTPLRIEAAMRDSFARREITAIVETAITRSPTDATAIAREAQGHFDVVAAVGGDGTVRDVAAGLRETPLPLAIIPNGTANVLAADLGIPLLLRNAMDLIGPEARTAPLDLGEVNGRPFVLNVGAGYAARVILNTPSIWKRRVGYLAYLPAAVRAAFARDRARATITVDGVQHEERAQVIFVANSGGVGGRLVQIAPDVRLNDGLFTVAVFAPRSPLALLDAFVRLAAQRHDAIPGAQFWEGKEITIVCDPPLPLQVDGDAAGRTPCTIRVLPSALRVIVPGAGAA